MYKVHCLNKISKVGTSCLSDNYITTETIEAADAILVRSAAMHDMEFSKNLKAIARAGAGVNNIPLDKCAEKGIVVFNTPGANANGVKELVIAGMLLASRDVVGGIEWVKASKDDANIAKTAEKEKKNFAGTELQGKKLGVIGLGAIGAQVANAAVSLGMEVYGYDNFLSVNAAWNISRSVKHVLHVEEIYEECDFITIHVPALPQTKGTINADAISLMKDGVIILNFANCDMVGHTGVFDAAVKAVEAVDECVGKAVEALKSVDGTMFICADHGNAEQLVDYETGEPFTAHTTNQVPFILVNYDADYTLAEDGCLADIVPTLIQILGKEQPAEMTGRSLLIKK